MSEAKKAEQYERSYPGALTDDSQKAARQDRMDFRTRQRGDGRRGSRFVSVPELPWKREVERGAPA